MAENEITVYSFAKTESSTLVARLYTNETGRRVDLRDFYERKRDGALRPTRRGVSVSVEQLPELKKAVDALLATAEQERDTG